ncbi:MAG: transporter [Nitrospirae bacterium]|nr:MAG: transporter [Nitrospirota bacterium]
MAARPRRLLLLVLLPALLAAAPAGPAAVVRRLQAALIESMRAGPRWSPEERRAHLAPVVEATHDLPFIARFALGRYWRRLDPAQRRRYLRDFAAMSIATYAERFDAYGGERFEVTGSERRPNGDVWVRTRLVKGDGGSVSLDYLLRRRDGRWRIVNVVAEGVSNLALKRAEYAGYVRLHGVEGLLARLEAKLAERGVRPEGRR